MTDANREAQRESIEAEKKRLEKRAMELLEDPNLMKRLVKVVQGYSNIVGEEQTIEAIIVICASSNVINRATTSTNMALDGSSGAGKDFIIDGVRKVLFRKRWQKYSNPTPTAIIYGQEKSKHKIKEGNKTVEVELTKNEAITSNTILYIKDASQNWLDHDDNKLLMEDDEINITKTIPGAGVMNLRFSKPTIFISTTETSIKHQLVRRLPNLPLDESEEQTKRIIEMQQKVDSFKIDEFSNEDLVIADFAMGLLKKANVSIDEVLDYINEMRLKNSVMLMRTLNQRMQDYIKFYAALYQFQREKDNNGRTLANKIDVDNGIKLFTYIYAGDDNKISTLNSRQKHIYNELRKHPGKRYSCNNILEFKKFTCSKPILYSDMDKIVKQTEVNQEGGYQRKWFHPKPDIMVEIVDTDMDKLKEKIVKKKEEELGI